MWGTLDFSVCSMRHFAVWEMIYINDFNRGLTARLGRSVAFHARILICLKPN